MLIEQRLLQPFVKAKYLSEGNFQRYTAIIHFLYQQHEVYYAPPALPTAILEHIQQQDYMGLFTDYTITELENDLKQLEEWGNVLSHQDTSYVTRIEDFHKRKLRYQCTQETIKIERLLESIDSQISRVNSALDPSLIDSLSTLVLRLESYKKKQIVSKTERNDIHQLWKQIFEKFDKLREESSDYLGIIHSKNIDEAMQNKEISAFRIKFTEYLTGFIIALQKNIHIMEHSLREIDQLIIQSILGALIENQKEIPTLDGPLPDEELYEIFSNQWNALKQWFLYDETNERYVDYLLKQTNETISIFTKYLQRMSERDQQVKNRKKDFEHIAKLFKNEAEFSNCQKSFGAITNIERPPHFLSLKERKVDTEKPLSEHEPERQSLRNAKEQIRHKKRVMVSIEQTEEDIQALLRLKQERQRQEEIMQSLIAQKVIILKEMKDVEPFVRKQFLQWISQVTGKKNPIGKTEQGLLYEVKKQSNDFIPLHCTDGVLQMPDYVFYFNEVKHS